MPEQSIEQSIADQYDDHKAQENQEEMESHLISKEIKSIAQQKAITDDQVQESLATDRKKTADIINAAVNEQKENRDLVSENDNGTENDNDVKTEALEEYYALNQEAKSIKKKMDSLKQTILSLMKPNELHIGHNHTVFVKPGAQKFDGYNDPKTILETIINSDIAVLDCIIFNRKIINEFIKTKRLPTSISKKERFTTIAPSLVFTKIIEK